MGADRSALETTTAYEQVATEVEPDGDLVQSFRYGLREDFDLLYRYTALLDRLEGKDANDIVQSYTDIPPGRPPFEHHRAPEKDLHKPYDRRRAHALSKLHSLTLMAAEQHAQLLHEHRQHILRSRRPPPLCGDRFGGGTGHHAVRVGH